MSIPANWNGDLVVFAHGWMFPTDPVALPDIAPFRDGLHARGYGLAVSENGFAVQDGVLRTRQVRDLFISKFGQPRRTYLSSGSMGAQIIMRLAQENPRHYDGVLPMCGPVGGSRMEIDYLMNVRVLFDYFYPGVIPETRCTCPQDWISMPTWFPRPLRRFSTTRRPRSSSRE